MSFRSVVVALILTFAFSARATDLTDLWWNPSESGWGVTATHQANIVFLTFFIYGQNGQALWVSSAASYERADATGNLIYSGALYQSTGPWFGAFFNPASVAATQVGSATFTVTAVNNATLSYSVNGVQVTKLLVRQAFQLNNAINGNYFGGFIGDTSGCAQQVDNGHFEVQSFVGVSGTTSGLTLSLQSGNQSCTFRGPYTQAGRMGRVEGTVTCTLGQVGNFVIFEIEANASALSARYNASYTNGCRESGHFGGVRR